MFRLTAACLLLIAAAPLDAAESKRLNIVFILADDKDENIGQPLANRAKKQQKRDITRETRSGENCRELRAIAGS